MNLNADEKKQIVVAYDTGDADTLRTLFAKAHGSCGTCTTASYIKQWMEYWLATNQLKRKNNVP